MINADAFWQVARAAPAGSEYLDGGTKRMFELVADIEPNSVAWMKVTWPYLELYLYEVGNGSGYARLEKIKKAFDVANAERPKDHGQEMEQDWVVKVTIP